MKQIKNKNLYYVGGYVRDEIIGAKSFDIDYCYVGNAIEFAKNLNIIKTNPDFGTVRVIINNTEIDIASTRIESYPKVGHLPVVTEIGCSLKEDLQRRDFTINALAKNTLTNEITDYFGGINDIKNKRIKVLHDKSFIEDPTRIIRGLKFRIRFGFELEEYTKKFQIDYLNNINYDLSYHRIKKELKETFNLNREKALDLFIKENIYKLLGSNQKKPEYNKEIETLINKYKPNNPWLVYMGLFDLTNFELTNEEKNIIDSYTSIKNKILKNKTDIYNTFKDLPTESILLYAITTNKAVAIDFLDRLSKIKISLTGKNLQEIGIPAGEIYKKIFNYVLDKKLKQPNTTLKDEIEWVKENFL